MQTPIVGIYCPNQNCGKAIGQLENPTKACRIEQYLPCKDCGENFIHWETWESRKADKTQRWCFYMIIMGQVGQTHLTICCPICGIILPPLSFPEHRRFWKQPKRTEFSCPECKGNFIYWKKITKIKGRPRFEIKIPELKHQMEKRRAEIIAKAIAIPKPPAQWETGGINLPAPFKKTLN